MDIPLILYANLYVSLLIRHLLIAMDSILDSVFIQDSVRALTAVVPHYALQSVDMLPRPARSRDISPVDHIREIILYDSSPA